MLESLPFGSDIIEVAIALAFMYMIFSSITSGIFEFIAKLLKMRASHLKAGLRLLLEDPDKTRIVDELYKHRLIKSKLRDKLGDPTYIDATKFATAVFDFITTDHSGEILEKKEEIINRINENIADEHLRTILTNAVNSASDKAEDVDSKLKAGVAKVETWFNGHMYDVSEWFKRKAKLWLGIIAAALTIGLNVDSVRIAKILWTDDEVRSATVQAASEYSDARMTDVQEAHKASAIASAMKTAAPTDSSGSDSSGTVTPPVDTTMSATEYFAELNETLDTVNALINQASIFPIGWGDECDNMPCCGKNCKPTQGADGTPAGQSCFMYWLLKFAGLAITWGAIFLGGPYWFDLLKRLVNWRKTISGGGTGGSTDPK